MSAVDVVSAVFLLSGGALALAAAVGVVRFPDVLSRMHAATKPQVLGILLVLAGAGMQLLDNVDLWMLVLTGAFQLVTAPVAAHLVGDLAYRSRRPGDVPLFVDELRDGEEPRPAQSTD